jgi:hypothetical protein
MNAPMNATGTANLIGFQTRLFVSTPVCWGLISALIISTALVTLANRLQPHIALPIDTSANMLISAVKLGRSHDILSLGDLRGLYTAELEHKLDGYRFKIKDGELRVL